jgi:hypothetical protein
MPELDALDRGYSPAGGTSQQTMPRNRKLTKVIAGRTVEAATAEPRSVVLLFDDDSRMKIKTTAPVAVPPGGEVKSVQEDETELKIEFEDDSTATFRLGDSGSSVAVRDRNNSVEYRG